MDFDKCHVSYTSLALPLSLALSHLSETESFLFDPSHFIRSGSGKISDTNPNSLYMTVRLSTEKK